VHANSKSINEKYYPQEDGGTGFPNDPRGRNAENGFLHHGVSASLWTKMDKDNDRQAVPSHSSTTLGQSHHPVLRTQIPYLSQVGSAGLSNLSGPLSYGSTAVKLDNHKERPKNPHWPEHRSGSRYQLDIADASATHHLLERPSSSHKKNERTGSKDSTGTVSPYIYDSHCFCIYFKVKIYFYGCSSRTRLQVCELCSLTEGSTTCNLYNL